MAIKGKGRTKRRGVAAAPKPVYVEPKRPFYARRRVQVGLGTIAGVVTGLLIEHRSHQRAALRTTEASIVARFGLQIDDNLSGVGQPFQTQFQPFPTLSTDITQFKSGALSSPKAAQEGRKWSHEATTAQAGIQRIPTAQMIQGHADLVSLSDGQSLISDSLSVYQQVGEALRLASGATGAERSGLVDHAQALLATAARVFNDGYQKLINERARFGLLQPPATAPQQQGLPSSVPSAITPSTSASTATGSRSGHKHHKKK